MNKKRILFVILKIQIIIKINNNNNNQIKIKKRMFYKKLKN